LRIKRIKNLPSQKTLYASVTEDSREQPYFLLILITFT